MDFIELLLLINAIAIWLVWYELRYGIERRKKEKKAAKQLSKKLAAESREKREEFFATRETANKSE